jgi:hypothetical protein
MKKQVMFVTMVGSSFYAYRFLCGQMMLFNNGEPLEVEDLRGVEVVARANNFTDIVFHQTPEGKWSL